MLVAQPLLPTVAFSPSEIGRTNRPTKFINFFLYIINFWTSLKKIKQQILVNILGMLSSKESA